jgi:prophage regulatory protein
MSLEHSPARTGLRVLRRKQVLDKLGISPATLYAWVAKGKFPKPIAIGANTKAWLEHEIDELLLQRTAERDQEQGPTVQRPRLRAGSV